MRVLTETPELVAERAALLARVEADRAEWPAVQKAIYNHPREVVIWRAEDGALAFDADVAEALDSAGYFRAAAEDWADSRSRAAVLSLARSPWFKRSPVAVVRGRGLHAPDDPDKPHAFRFKWPQNRTGFAFVTAEALAREPRNYPQPGIKLYVEELEPEGDAA